MFNYVAKDKLSHEVKLKFSLNIPIEQIYLEQAKTWVDVTAECYTKIKFLNIDGGLYYVEVWHNNLHLLSSSMGNKGVWSATTEALSRDTYKITTDCACFRVERFQ